MKFVIYFQFVPQTNINNIKILRTHAWANILNSQRILNRDKICKCPVEEKLILFVQDGTSFPKIYQESEKSKCK